MIHYFLHIPKCGGETIKQYYFKTFSSQESVKIWNPIFGADCDTKHFQDYDITGKKCINGHLHFTDALNNNTFKQNFEQNNIIIHTVVRDPIDRMISLYNYMFNFKQHPEHEKIKSISINDFLSKRRDNFQSKMLGIEYWGSLKKLYNNIQIIDLERSNEYFHKYFSENLSPTIPLMKEANVTAEKFGLNNIVFKEDLPKKIIKEIKYKNKLDYKLYELAKKAL
jgi:hypothetical protein